MILNTSRYTGTPFQTLPKDEAGGRGLETNARVRHMGGAWTGTRGCDRWAGPGQERADMTDGRGLGAPRRWCCFTYLKIKI